jgi:hemolysin activation/secretion protein
MEKIHTNFCFCFKNFLALFIFASFFQASLSWGQNIPFDRPGDVQPELPEFESPERKKILPDIDVPKGPDTKGLSGGVQILIKRYMFNGNTILTDEDLKKIAAPYTNKKIYLSELEKLRDKITSAYIKLGYINSGAVIPDQDIKGGVFNFQIIEGTLAGISVETDGRFRKNYIINRLEGDTDAPLDIFGLEKRLQVLQMDDRIQRIDAKLRPGEKRGEAILLTRVKENKPFQMSIDFNNYQPPTVGDFRGVMTLAHNNLLGFGDRLIITGTKSQDFRIVDASYSVPVTRWDTLAEVYFRKSWSTVNEKPFDVLEIDSKISMFGSRITQPIFRSLNHIITLILTGEYKRSETFLLGLPFSFSEGPINGVSKMFVTRFAMDYVFRGRKQVMAVRSTFSLGLNELYATTNVDRIPDGQFFSWLGQFQYALRLPWLNMQILARGNAQLANKPLLGLEQFSVGGHASVRGYRENQLVNDNGTTGSLEVRIPLWISSGRKSFVELAAFSDAGYSWNQRRPTMAPRVLLSAGVGARIAITKHFLAQCYWGHQFRKVPKSTQHDIQDDGIHFGVSTIF